jgi:hypothetical protein
LKQEGDWKMIESHKNMLSRIENFSNEIGNLYRVVEEIFSEYTRLKEKRDNGKANYEDIIRLSLLEHLINYYYYG